MHDRPMVSSKVESRNLTPLGIPKPKQAGTSQLEPRSTFTGRSRFRAHSQGLRSVSFLPPPPAPASEAPPRPPLPLGGAPLQRLSAELCSAPRHAQPQPARETEQTHCEPTDTVSEGPPLLQNGHQRLPQEEQLLRWPASPGRAGQGRDAWWWCGGHRRMFSGRGKLGSPTGRLPDLRAHGHLWVPSSDAQRTGFHLSLPAHQGQQAGTQVTPLLP